VPPVPVVWSVVVAGGSGRRFGEPKQFASLHGRPVVSWSVDACRRHSAGVVLVLPAGTGGHPADLAATYGADRVVEGGPTRTDSARLGLDAVPDDAQVVLIHDAARPLADDALFRAVIDAVTAGADGAIPGVPVSDTIKVVDGAEGDAGRTVTATLDRTALVAVQTPQGFGATALRAAHASGLQATDDAALVEARGGTVRVVPGDPQNVKITTPADLGTAERLLAARAGEV
jgi:2-C-methyl-D-erythritol 4-phosphate cytidylyltransferase